MTATAPPANVCSSCGAGMDPARSTYDKQGNLVCPTCASRNQIAEGDARAVSSLVGTAVGVLIAGALSWTCLNMFFVLSLVTVVSGVGWLVMIARAPAQRQKMGGKFVPCLIAASVGTILAAIPLGLVALGLTASALAR